MIPIIVLGTIILWFCSSPVIYRLMAVICPEAVSYVIVNITPNNHLLWYLVDGAFSRPEMYIYIYIYNYRVQTEPFRPIGPHQCSADKQDGVAYII